MKPGGVRRPAWRNPPPCSRPSARAAPEWISAIWGHVGDSMIAEGCRVAFGELFQVINLDCIFHEPRDQDPTPLAVEAEVRGSAEAAEGRLELCAQRAAIDSRAFPAGDEQAVA